MQKAYHFDYDLESGDISNQKVCVDVPEDFGEAYVLLRTNLFGALRSEIHEQLFWRTCFSTVNS